MRRGPSRWSPCARQAVWVVVAAALGSMSCRGGAGQGPPPVRVAAAADLMVAFEELASLFETETGHRVTLTFGSTGLLAAQIREGAPFDVFAAANVDFVDQVVASGACDGTTRALYGRGRIVTWVRLGTGPVPSLAELTDARFRRIAIANPEHAPYGMAARDALASTGVWARLWPRLVFGENVRQAMQLAETGNADSAIVALALVIADSDGAWELIDEHLHAPIDQALVVCQGGQNAEGGRAFAALVGSPEGRAVMRRHGFALPGEELVFNR